MFLGEDLFKEKVLPEPLSKTFLNKKQTKFVQTLRNNVPSIDRTLYEGAAPSFVFFLI